MNNLKTTAVETGNIYKKQFLVTASDKIWIPARQEHFHEVQLTNFNTDVLAGYYSGNPNIEVPLHIGTIIEADISIYSRKGQTRGYLQRASLVGFGLDRRLETLFLVDACPGRAVGPLLKIIDMVEDFRRPELKDFVLRVFSDTELSKSFLSTRAGKSFHHNYPGGLVEHTHEVMTQAKEKALRIYPNETEKVELIVTAALLHDLGKTITLGSCDSEGTGEYDHDQYTKSLVEQPLETLKLDWPWGGKELEEMLDWFARSTKKRTRLEFFGAQLVHNADMEDVMKYRSELEGFRMGRPPANDDTFHDTSDGEPEDSGDYTPGFFSKEALSVPFDAVKYNQDFLDHHFAPDDWMARMGLI